MTKQFSDDLKRFYNHSSRGNQFKWVEDDVWYKADALGYEGLSEYVIAELLKHSSLKNSEYVDYQLEKLKIGNNVFNGCKSISFLSPDEELITLERLFQLYAGESLTSYISQISSVKERVRRTVDIFQTLCGFSGFGEYLSKIIVIDAMFLNDDRHFHNIALIRNRVTEQYRFAPVFDNGAALLSDMMYSYPYDIDISSTCRSVKSKSFDESFEKQLDAFEELYGLNMTFSFSEEEIESVVQSAAIYEKNLRDRVISILKYQRNRFSYYFD